MVLYSLVGDPQFSRPILVLALSGWVDAAAVGTGAADFVAAEGEVVASFDRDALFDFRSNRPILHFEDGELEEIIWPSLEVKHRVLGGRDVLILSGNEPDFNWQHLSAEMAELSSTLGVSRLITLGAVPAAVPHTLPPPVMTTASDDGLVLQEDVVLTGTLVVPGAAVSILRQSLVEAGIPAVGYWAQVPHYLNRPYHAGVLALVEKVARQLEVEISVGELMEQAAEQRVELDRIVEGRADTKAYIERLEQVAGEELPTADEIAAEVERFLQQESGNDPFSGLDDD